MKYFKHFHEIIFKQILIVKSIEALSTMRF